MGFRVSALKWARWVVWILLAWVLLRGVVSIVAPPPEATSEVPQPAPQPVVAVDREAPGAFAALFAREYLSWEIGKEEDRAGRLQPLLASHLDRNAGWSAGAKPLNQTAEATWPFRVTETAEKRWLVTVAARVTVTAAPAPDAKPAVTPRTLYLAVPVAQGEGGYVVYDYPTLVPAPAAATLRDPVLPGEEFTDQGGQVRTLLTGFFRAYATGGAADVTYYLEPGVTVAGLHGAFTFKEVTELSLRRVDQQTLAAAVTVWEDPVTGTVTRQRHTLEVVQRDGRWYIKAIVQKGA